MIRPLSADVEQLVGLESEPPARVRETIRERRLHVAPGLLGVARVERLKEELVELEIDEPLGLRGGMTLRIDELELVAARQREGRVGLRAHTDVIDPRRRKTRPVRLHRDLEAARMQRIDGRGIELQQWLSAGADDERPSIARTTFDDFRPAREHGVGERGRVGEAATVGADAEEVRVAELTDGVVPVGLAARPEVATAEAAEHGGTAGVLSFALQRVEDLLDGVRHVALRRPARRSASDPGRRPRRILSGGAGTSRSGHTRARRAWDRSSSG